MYLANINADNQTVIAGSDAAMKLVAARIKGNGVAKRLAVSVPSHCALLEAPAQALAQAFVTLKAPRITYLSSTRARPIHNPEQLRDDLAFNMCRIVMSGVLTAEIKALLQVRHDVQPAPWKGLSIVALHPRSIILVHLSPSAVRLNR